MPLLLLRGQWPGQFHRVIRNEQGEAIRTVEFSKDEPVEVSEEELELFRDDIGPALWLVEPNGSGGWTILDDGKRLQDITPGRIEYLGKSEEITFATPSRPVPLAAGNAVKEPPETSVTTDQEKVDPITESTDPPATETAAAASSEQVDSVVEEVPAPVEQVASTDAAQTTDAAKEQPPEVVPPKKNVDDF